MDLVTPTAAPSSDPAAREDGAFINLLTGMGVAGRDKSTATQLVRGRFLSAWDQEQLYVAGLPRRYIDSIADETYKKPATIELGDEINEDWPDFNANFTEYLSELHFAEKLSEVTKLQRLYGGAALVLLLNDGQEADQPLNIKKLISVDGIVPLSRWEIVPEQFDMIDPQKPEFYRISTSQKMVTGQTTPFTFFRIHESRVIRFDGLYLPWMLRSSNQGWGLSVLDGIYSAYRRYQTAMKGLEAVTADAELFVHKLPNLFTKIASGNEDQLKKRMEANVLSRSVYNGMLLDKEEEVEFMNRNLGGLAEVTKPFLEELQVITGWPASYLTGISPGGMGRDGRFEDRQWATVVSAWQTVYLLPGVRKLFKILMQAKTSPSRGEVPKNWSVKFPSVFTLSEIEEADLKNNTANADSTYINLGVLSPLEVRLSRFTDAEFKTNTTLLSNVTEQMEAKADMEFESTILQNDYQKLAMAKEAELAAEEQEGEVEGEEETAEEGAAPTSALPENGKQVKEAIKTTKKDSLFLDSTEYRLINGCRFQLNKTIDKVSLGQPTWPNGSRLDNINAPNFLLGESNAPSKFYSVQFKNKNFELSAGPFATGFQQRRQLMDAITKFFPAKELAGIEEISGSQLANLKLSWGDY